MNNPAMVQLYSSLIRDVINHAAQRIDTKPFLEKARIRLGFERADGWTLVTSCLDLLDDTELAKGNYSRFQLAGPTKYDEKGEMYLRLYGILNAVYLQMSAIAELAELFKVPDKTRLLKSMQLLPILQLRHIAGSHTVSFLDPVTKRKRSYMIGQHSLTDAMIEVLDDDNKVHQFDLSQLMKDFDKIAEAVLDAIADKAIRTICKTDAKGKSTFGDGLDRIRKTSQGDHFVDLPDGGVLHINVVK